MANVKRPERVFQLGSMTLEDPDPSLSPEEALALYRGSYPAIAHCTLARPREEAGRLVYEVQRPPATTKGRLSDTDALEREIAGWEQRQARQATAAADPAIVTQARNFLDRRANADSPATPNLNPRSIPMC